MKYEVDGRVVEISKVGENAFLIDGVALFTSGNAGWTMEGDS